MKRWLSYAFKRELDAGVKLGEYLEERMLNVHPVNCKMIKCDVKLSYTTVMTPGITRQLGLFTEEAGVGELGHIPTCMPHKKQMIGRIL